MARIPPSVFVRALYGRIGDAPGAGLLLVVAAQDFEESETLPQQLVLWSWWISAARVFSWAPSLLAAEQIVSGGGRFP